MAERWREGEIIAERREVEVEEIKEEEEVVEEGVGEGESVIGRIHNQTW